MLPKRAVLKTLPRLNMSLLIGDIYLKEVWDLLFVRMLTVNLQNLPRSIPAKEANLHVIFVASLGTLGHIVLRSELRSLGSRSKSQRKVNMALILPSLIMILVKSGNSPKGLIPHAVIVVRLARPKSNASS
jgi:hypothetical protein